MATLTQTEQGRREPVTHVGQPSSIRRESGTHTHSKPCPNFSFQPCSQPCSFWLCVQMKEKKSSVKWQLSGPLLFPMRHPWHQRQSKNIFNISSQKLNWKERQLKLGVTGCIQTNKQQTSLWDIFYHLGLICTEILRPASRTWDQSAYLQHQCQELREVLQDMDIRNPVTQV